MPIDEQHIEFTKNGRYFTYGNPEKADHLIFALHGYGYLASYFIKKFEILDSTNFFVVCPEANHRFYLAGTEGKVGASWMTKEDRLTDIRDYINFLNAIADKIINENSFEEKTLLGFSQGGATASRWLEECNHNFNKFILWAAVFPHDMKLDNHSKFINSYNYFIVGNKDEYYNEEKINSQLTRLKNSRVKFEFIKFDGYHNINSELLLKILL